MKSKKKAINLLLILFFIIFFIFLLVFIFFNKLEKGELKNLFIATKETLLQTLIATFFAYLIGLPLGIILNITSKNGLTPKKYLNLILGIIVNILRSIPCLILVVICMPLTRLIFNKGTGRWYTILIPLIITACGFVSRMVEQSLNEVSLGKIEAFKSLGASYFQIIIHVLLSETKSSLISGICVSAVTLLGYTSFAYNIASGGLIAQIYTFYSRNTGNFMSSFYFWILIIVTILIVQLIQELGLYLAKKIDKRRF